MRPESCRELRDRMAGKARHLLAACFVNGTLTVPAKNGVAKAMPTAATVAGNRDLKAGWDAAAAAHGLDVAGGLVPTALGVDLYRATEITFFDVGSVASFLGQGWPATVREVSQIIADIPDVQVPELLRAILGLPLADVKILRALCIWRASHTEDEIAALMLREVSVSGMGTKWMERNAGIILSVFDKAGWTVASEGSLAERLGLDDPDRSEVRVRIHPDDARRHRLWPRFAVPSTEFSEFSFEPSRVLILENKTTFLRVKAERGTVVIWGSGMAIVSWAKRMDWLHAVPDQVYWGDCDGAGYLILDRLRGVLPRMRSVNMTLAEILPNIGKAVAESTSEAVTAGMPNLTADEVDARRYMHEKRLRLEQEFIIPRQTRDD